MNAPTGILLGQFTPGTEEWDRARAGLCITATEIAAVLGLSPWQSRFSLWHKKAGLPSPPFEVSPEMEWGTRHEPTIAQKYTDEHPDLTLHTTGTWQHRDREWQRATPDRLAADRLVELKFSPTGDPWADGLPVYYRTQTLWQMDVLGYRRTDVALLVGGCDYQEFTVEYDEADAELMRTAAVEFLGTVRRGERPPLDDSDATYQTIRRQPTGFDDTEVEIPGEVADRFEAAQADIKRSLAELTGARSEVLDHLGTGRRAVHLGRQIAYRTAKPDGTTRSLQPARKGIAA